MFVGHFCPPVSRDPPLNPDSDPQHWFRFYAVDIVRISSSHAMSQPEEFSLESVRQLMLAHGGRVTNHSLVKSYRQWLTDPQLKDQARAQFKVSIIVLGAVSSPAEHVSTLYILLRGGEYS
jgi:hypothetical protein